MPTAHTFSTYNASTLTNVIGIKSFTENLISPNAIMAVNGLYQWSTSIDCTYDGYTPIGVMQIHTNSGESSWVGYTSIGKLNGADNLKVYGLATASSSITVSVTILYIKNGFVQTLPDPEPEPGE